jgi:hypothetical protein
MTTIRMPVTLRGTVGPFAVVVMLTSHFPTAASSHAGTLAERT